MDATYTVEFEEFPLGSYAGLTTPYFVMKLTEATCRSFARPMTGIPISWEVCAVSTTG